MKFLLQAIPILALALGLGKALAKGNTKNLLLTEGPEDWPDLLRSGPYTTVISEGSLEITTFSCDKACTLKLYLASPLRTPGMTPRSVPVVLMFSGFQMPASYYASYAHGLASWGFATLQYDLPGSLMQKIVRDDDEITVIPTLLAWLHQQSMDPASAIYEIVDTRCVAGFGHSRGAKLVALALAGGVGNLQAVVMVDPVDMTSYTRSKGYPSAVEALKAKPNKALIIGAGLSGWCNPSNEGWAAFWPVISPGSWLHMIKPAGHMQFLDVKGFSQWSLDHLCGAGNVTHKLVIHLTQGVAAAWLQKTFRPTESVSNLSAYLAWASQQTHLGTLMSLEVKTNPSDAVTSHEFKMNTADVSRSDEIKLEPADVKQATAELQANIAEQ